MIYLELLSPVNHPNPAIGTLTGESRPYFENTCNNFLQERLCVMAEFLSFLRLFTEACNRMPAYIFRNINISTFLCSSYTTNKFCPMRQKKGCSTENALCNWLDHTIRIVCKQSWCAGPSSLQLADSSI